MKSSESKNNLLPHTKAIKHLGYIAAGAISVMVVGCASMDSQTETAADPGSVTQSPESSEDASQPEVQEVSSTSASLEAKQAKADALMASLKEEPGDEMVSSAEPAAAAKPVQIPQAKSAQSTADEKSASRVASQAEQSSSTDTRGTSSAAASQSVKADKVSTTATSTVKKDTVAAETKPAPTAAEAMEPKPEPKPEPKAAGSSGKFTLADLPLSYDIWKIKRGQSRLDNDVVIGTPTWEMGERGYMSQIWLTLMEDKVLVNSSSDIDGEAPGSGIRIDSGELIPFTRIADNNVAVVEGNFLDDLARGVKVRIYMGFFPDREPRSDTYESELRLDNLTKVVSTYKTFL